MKNLKCLVLFFVFLGLTTSSFAKDFLDRYEVKANDWTNIESKILKTEMLAGYFTTVATVISQQIHTGALSRVLPAEYLTLQRLSGLKKASKESLTDLRYRLKNTKNALKNAKLDAVKYGGNASHVKNLELQVAKLKEVNKKLSSSHGIYIRKLRKTKETLRTAHKALMAGKTNLGSGLKVSPRQVRLYKKVFRASNLMRVVSGAATIYFASDLLFRFGILVFTEKAVGGKIPAIETGKYLIEKLKSGEIKTGNEADMDVESFKIELSEFINVN